MQIKKIHIYIIFILGFLSIVLSQNTKAFTQEAAGKSNAKSFIWEVSSEKTTVYILGSVHVAKQNLYPLSNSIEKAFADSSKLVLEINPLTVDNSKIREMIIKDGLYPDGDSIKNHIKPELSEMLNNYLKQENMTIGMVQNMKPGLLAITLSMYQMTSLGYTEEYGIDNYFVRKSEGSKDILELETIEDQVSLLLNMPDEALFLEYTLMEMQNIQSYMDQIYENWKTGDSKGMYEFVLKPYEQDPSKTHTR